MAPKYKFHEGERVLCFHGPILYEAKCVKIQAKDKVVKYYVHYQGWNKSWDEWVPESRVLKYNEANVQKQKELQEAQNAAKPKGKSSRKRNSGAGGGDKEVTGTPKIDKSGKSKSGSTPGTGGSGGGGGGGGSSSSSSGSGLMVTPSSESKEVVGGGSGGGVEKETGGKKRRTKVDQITEDIQNLPEVKILMPEELKKILKEDWEIINKNNKLVLVPAQTTVDDILEEYVNFKKKETSLTPPKMSIIFEITNGIREYFNTTLGTLLLYKTEREQFEQVRKDGEDEILPSSIYGFIHLIRLFTKFGNLFAHSHSDEKTIQVLIPHFDDFLSYCAKNVTIYYSKDEYAPSSSSTESPKKC